MLPVKFVGVALMPAQIRELVDLVVDVFELGGVLALGVHGLAAGLLSASLTHLVFIDFRCVTYQVRLNIR